MLVYIRSFFSIAVALLIVNSCDAQGQAPAVSKMVNNSQRQSHRFAFGRPTCSEIGSYVKRELRSLGDVTVVDDNPSWVLTISFVNLKSTMDHAVDGIVMNASVQRFIDTGPLMEFLRLSTRPAPNPPSTNLKMDEIVSTFKDALKYATDARSSMENLLWGGLKASSLCVRIVTVADTELFEPQRQAWNKNPKTQPTR